MNYKLLGRVSNQIRSVTCTFICINEAQDSPQDVRLDRSF